MIFLGKKEKESSREKDSKSSRTGTLGGSKEKSSKSKKTTAGEDSGAASGGTKKSGGKSSAAEPTEAVFGLVQEDDSALPRSDRCYELIFFKTNIHITVIIYLFRRELYIYLLFRLLIRK